MADKTERARRLNDLLRLARADALSNEEFNEIVEFLPALAAELDAAEKERDELKAWGQQIHDALDGRPLPEYPDSAPARIVALEKRNGELEAFVRDARPLLGIGYSNSLGGRADRLLAASGAGEETT